jgi:hypothetical protein
MAGGRTDVDAVIGVCGMADDAFVFFIEGVDGPPCEGHSFRQRTGVAR